MRNRTTRSRVFHSLAALAVILAARLAAASAVEERLAAMSDREKVAQLLFVGLPGPVEDAAVREIAGDWHAGGVVLFAHNIESPQQVRRLNEAIVRNAGDGAVPLIAIDQEGGIVRRLQSGVPVVPSAMAIGATQSPDLARRAGAAVGSALRSLGFTMNFAPVLDVLTSRKSPAIGTRAFSDDPRLVAALGAAFIAGQQEAGVLATGKHFPGLGAVDDDPHRVLPRLDADLTLLRNRELVPFAAAFRVRMAAVMTAHMAIPRVAEKPDVPATLSSTITTGLLREEMHFEGIVITDALQMDALVRARGAGALALDAILAGSDMVLALGSAQERRQVFDFLLAALREGRLPRRRVDDSVRRILAAKERLRANPKAVDDPALLSDIAENAITLVPGSAAIPKLPAEGVLYAGPVGRLQEMLGARHSLLFPERMSAAETELLLAKARVLARDAKLCVAAATNERELALVSRLRSKLPAMPIVFVNLGSPWRVLIGPKSSTLLTYAEDAASQSAAARVLLTQSRAPGITPVTLPSPAQPDRLHYDSSAR